MRRKWMIVLAMVVALPLAAPAQSSTYYDRSYTRMSYVQGDAFVQRAQDLGYEQGQVNLVVIEGDKLGTKAGRLEVQLGLRNYLRLDNDTQVEVASLPTADGLPTKLHILGGSLYLRVETMDGEKAFEIHTPDASFYILREGLYRVDVRGARETELSVFEGAAEAAGQEGSRVVEARQRISAADGRFVSEPFSLIARRDDFSAWNDAREALFARRTTRSSSYIPAEYSDYGYELDSYGDWTNDADYGNVWVPRGVGADWRPYTYGRWVWYPVIGWTWVSYDSWGWCTHHYGRWGWRFGLGWYWIPRGHWGWGPAWVNWWYDGDYIGWCPLSYYNRPCVIVNNIFYDRYDRYDYRSYGRTLMAVNRNQLQHRNLQSVAVGADRIEGRVGDIAFRGESPNLRPAVGADSMIRGRASEAFSGRNARTVERGFAGNGRQLSAGEIRSSVRGGGEAVSGAGSRTVRDGSFNRSNESGRSLTGRTQDGGAGVPSRSGEARNIRSYPSQGGRVDAGSSRVSGSSSRDSSSRISGSSMREYPSSRGSESSSSRVSGSSSRESGASSRTSSSRISGSSMREYPSSRGSESSSSRVSGSSSRESGVSSRSSSSRVSGSSMREYPSSRSYDSSSSRVSGSSSRESGVSSRSSSSRISGSSMREYPSSRGSESSSSRVSGSSSRESGVSSRSSSSRISGSTSREYPSSSLSSGRSYGSSSSSSRSYSTRESSPTSRSYSSPSVSSRSYGSSSSSRGYSSRESSVSSRSYSSPSSSRSYSAPSRSYSSPSISSRGSSSSSSSRSYSAPSRSSSSSSRVSSSSRSSSGGSVSRGSSSRSSSRSSGGSSRRR